MSLSNYSQIRVSSHCDENSIAKYHIKWLKIYNLTNLTCKNLTFYTTLTHWGRRQSKRLILLTNIDKKSLETEFTSAICRPTGNKWQSKTLFLAIFDLCQLLRAFLIAAYQVCLRALRRFCCVLYNVLISSEGKYSHKKCNPFLAEKIPSDILYMRGS